jgi:predicted transposase YbfD/YdcC
VAKHDWFKRFLLLPNGIPSHDTWERETKGKKVRSSQYYLTSYAGTAAEIGRLIRGHWGIENQLHGVLDVVFGEDESRTRDTKAGANLSMLRKIAVSLLKNVKAKGSIETRRLRAGWDDEFLLQVIQGIPED